MLPCSAVGEKAVSALLGLHTHRSGRNRKDPETSDGKEAGRATEAIMGPSRVEARLPAAIRRSD